MSSASYTSFIQQVKHWPGTVLGIEDKRQIMSWSNEYILVLNCS